MFPHSPNFVKTPYSPHSTFEMKQSPFELSTDSPQSRTSGSCLLDDPEDPLAALYKQILRFVERTLSKLLELAEKVSARSNHRPVENENSADNHEEDTAGFRGFAILANVIWAEIGRALMEELGSVVFSSSRPIEFRKVSTPRFFH